MHSAMAAQPGAGFDCLTYFPAWASTHETRTPLLYCGAAALLILLLQILPCHLNYLSCASLYFPSGLPASQAPFC